MATTIRPLGIGDLPHLQRLFGARCPPLAGLGRELLRSDTYAWLGLWEGQDQLVATHRAMRLGDALLLKGVSVASTHRGSTAALRLAFAVKEHARTIGCECVAAWIEPHRPERFLADRLAIEAAGPLVHRYRVPLAPAPEDRHTGTDVPLRGGLRIELTGPALVPNLPAAAPGVLGWVVDGRRIVLGGNPCRTPADLPEVLEQVAPHAHAAGADGVEIPWPAADLVSAFTLMGRGASRLSRTPVSIGRAALRRRVPDAPNIEATA